MEKSLRVLFWGTYDIGKPRIRILRSGLRSAWVEVDEIHFHVWNGIEDKSQVDSKWRLIRLAFFCIIKYHVLLFKYVKSHRYDYIVCGYFGYFDAILLWPFAKLRREPIILDAFLPIYNTVIEDRRLFGQGSLLARLIFVIEKLSLKAADIVLVDTDAHGRYFAQTFGLAPSRIVRAFVGVERETFRAGSIGLSSEREKKVLFYGQFIPLHGVETVVEAARLLRGTPIKFKFIGTGQEAVKIRSLMSMDPLPNLEWVEWVEYEDLQKEIARSAVCLGIFGTSDKASRVIPNKVFQIVSAGKPLITRDSSAIRELFKDGSISGVWLIQAGNARALAEAVLRATEGDSPVYSDQMMAEISPPGIGARLATDLCKRSSK
jgi:glycosyltransferase involved in cell wall biosynthesis